MARCGCNAASATTCDAIVLCVAANLGPGLRYDTVTGQLAVRLSGDAGNAARFGSDDGIFVPGPDTSPDPASGRKTIAGLPARAFAASNTGGGNMIPFGSPDGIEYGIANRMDILQISTFALADGVAIARWDGPNTSLSSRTDNPSSIQTKMISSVTLPSLLVDAGARDTPTGRLSGAPPALLSPDGGWFGFYARNFTPITLTEALHQVAARAVVHVAVYAGVVQEELERFLAGAMRAVIQAGAQDWAMVSVPGYMLNDEGTDMIIAPLDEWVSDMIAAGITPIVDLFDDSAASTVVTPAQVVASGSQWVRFNTNGTSYERMQEFVDAGLQVDIQVRSSRHWEVQQAYGIGARVVAADSPVYARGARGESGDLDYRKTTVIPGLLTRTMMEGCLTQFTEDGISTQDIGWARQSAEGRNFSAGFGRVNGIGARITSQLLGELCPYEVTPSHRLRVRFRVDPTQTTPVSGTVPKLGLFVAAPTDRDTTTFDDGVTPPHLNPWVNGYWCHVRVGTDNQGQVTLGKVTDGVYEVLENSESFPSITYGEWIYMSVTLTTTNVILATGHNPLPNDIIYNVADATHRGPYAFYAWEDDFTPPITNAGFAHGYSAYQQFQTTAPMYEDLS